ncbi:MAG: TonB-dependent receptor plug domain-containing protein [Bacteroidales bacterium]
MKYKYTAILFLLHLFILPGIAQQVIILTDSMEIPELSLEEVEIKASKDNLTMKRMPASVTLFSSKRIIENEVHSLTDISSLTPGFFMPDYGSKLTSPVYIRGIGSRINSPSVGLYVDNVPYFEKASYDFDFFNVERIEILKGPQGTLYGRNAMGGIINIVTRSPMNYQGTRVGITTGSHGVLGGSLGHFNKIGKAFGYSISANYRHKEGYYFNSFLNDKVDRSNTIGLRNKLSWQINDRLTVENIASFENSAEGGYPYALLNDSLLIPEEINYNQPSSYARSMFSDAVVISYQGENVEMKSTTSYQYLDDLQEIDQDFTPDSAYFVMQDQNQHMLSQEFILRSKGETRFKWLFGSYGFMQRFDKQVDVSIYQANMNVLKNYDHTIGGVALFHQFTLNDLIVQDLSLTAGVRLDAEKDILAYIYDREIAGNLTHLEDTIYPTLAYMELLPKIALNYVVHRSSFYAVIAKGYKTGGFNSTFYKEEDLFFAPEFSWNYEIGMKSALFSNKIYTDLSLYYIDWKNQQIYQPVFYKDDTPAPGSLLKNAGRSVSKGGEITMKSVPFAGFSPVVSYGYTHAIFKEHKVDDNTDYRGNYIPYVPRHTVAAQVNKTFRMNNDNLVEKISLNLLYRGMGEIFWNEENSFSTDYYGTVDVKMSLAKGGINIEFWGKNILGAEYESFYFQALGNQYVQTGKPLRFGFNLNYEF